MANNQHDLSELQEEDIMRSPFARVRLSRECVGTVLLCDSDVTPMKRVWCVFEMHITESLRSGRLGSKGTHFLDVMAIVPNESSLLGPVSRHHLVAAMLQDALGGNWHEDRSQSCQNMSPLIRSHEHQEPSLCDFQREDEYQQRPCVCVA